MTAAVLYVHDHRSVLDRKAMRHSELPFCLYPLSSLKKDRTKEKNTYMYVGMHPTAEYLMPYNVCDRDVGPDTISDTVRADTYTTLVY